MALRHSLKNLRRSFNLTQADVGKKLGVSAANYGGYETGKRAPSIDKLLILSKLYGVTIDHLVCNENIETLRKNIQTKYLILQQRYDCLKDIGLSKYYEIVYLGKKYNDADEDDLTEFYTCINGSE